LDVAHLAHEQADVLDARAPRAVAIGDVMAGVVVQLGAEEAGTPLAGTRAIPMEAHHIEQETLQFRGVFRGDQHYVPGTTLVGQETGMRPPGNERAWRPFLTVEQLVLVTHRIAETHHLSHPTQLAKSGVATCELDAGCF